MPISDVIGQQLDRSVGRTLGKNAGAAGAKTLEQQTAEALGLSALGGSQAFNDALVRAHMYQHAVGPEQAVGMYQDALKLSTSTKTDLGVLDSLNAHDATTRDMVVPILSQADAHIATATDAQSVVDKALSYSNFYRGDTADEVAVTRREHPLATPLAWLDALKGKLLARQIDKVGTDARSRLTRLAR